MALREHAGSMKWHQVLRGLRYALQAFETRSQRGMKRLQADPMFPVSGHRVNKDESAPAAPANGGKAGV